MRGAGVDLSADQIIGRLTDEVTAELGRAIDWRPGAVELVRALRDAGIPQAIVTTSPRDMTQVVRTPCPPARSV